MSAFSNTTPGSGWSSKALFQVGKGKTLAVPMEVHQVARAKVVDAFSAKGINTGIVLLQGGDDLMQYDSDIELVFRQDSWFNYVFGVKEPGMYGAISLRTKKATLFIPKLPADYATFMGVIHPPSHFLASYAVDEVLYAEDLQGWLTEELKASDAAAKIHLMSGTNSDSGAEAVPAAWTNDKVFGARKDTSQLFHIVATARVTKCPMEVEVMRYAAFVASNAHVETMRDAKNCEFEYELEAKFCYEIYKKGGCRKNAYTNICGCGPNAATLHYGHAGAPNDRPLQPTDIALLDMGADYHGYVSDITCSFPVCGRFTEDQKAIFEGVLNAQRAVLGHYKPGNTWPDCHRLAEREILKGVVKTGVLIHPGSSALSPLTGDSLESLIDSLMEVGMGRHFMPHGLGHLIGCDTHDVGGYIEGTPARDEYLKNLRTARVLEAHMVLTIEPGCYFIDHLLDQALIDPVKSKFIDPVVLEKFRGFGGVRLEDVVLVTPTGQCPDNLTTCPRTVQEIEYVIAGGDWPPQIDSAPELCRRWTQLAPNGLGMIDITPWKDAAR